MGAGIRLKEILRNKKMTIKQLSEKADISIYTLYSITKRDSENIDPAIFKRILVALDISADDFWGIPPLPPQEIPLFDNDPTPVVWSSADQEFNAFNEYLEGIGYRTVLELGPDNPDLRWSVYDIRSGKRYLVESNTLNNLMNNVNSYTKYLINEILKNSDS